MTQTSLQINSASVSDRGLSEKRPQNEDSFLEVPERGLFAVADGVGGAQAGDVASQMAMEILGEAFANLPNGGDVEELMQLAIRRANEAIHQMSLDLPQLSTMATTIVALHVADDIATIGHVGDSRIYRLDSKGNLYRETQDHSVVEEEVRAGRMTPAQAANHPSRNVISRALGAEPAVEVDMKTIMFEPNTMFLLCSDGITRHIEDLEIRDLLGAAAQPSQICAKMKEICYSRGAEDNLTAVIVRVGDSADENFSGAEENTVATARAPLVNSGIFAENSPENYQEQPTRDLRLPENSENADEDFVQSERPIVSNSSIEKSAVETTSEREFAPVVSEDGNYVEEKSGFGKILPVLLSLLIGAIVGAGLMYAFASPAATPKVAEVPPMPTPQTTNIEYSAFENLRREVDKNPQAYLQKYAANPQDASDFYLLGRANLMTGKYVEAKTAFQKAKTLLPQTQEINRKVLENDIIWGLSIVDSTFSKSVIEAEKKSLNSTEIAPVNANSAAANSQIR